MTFYAILGIPSDADQETIRNSYKTLVRRFHPDRGPGSSPEKFRRVVEAYETLSDPQRRELYDRSLRHNPPSLRVPVEPMTARPVPMFFDRTFTRRPPLDELFDELFEVLFDRLFFRSPWH